MQETRVPSLGGKIPWRRLWQASPVFLPGKSQDRGAWRVTFHGVAKTETQLSSHPTQLAPVSPAFSCQEQSVAARISGRPLAAPENQPDHIPFNSPKSVLHPPLHLVHIRFPPLWIPLFPHVCCLLIPSLVRESVSALPHPLFGVSSSEILGNSGSCHSTGFSVHYPPRDCLSLFPDIIITQRFTQHMAVSATMKVPPASSGSDTSPCPLTSVGLSHNNDAGVLIWGASLQFPSATGTVTDTHLTTQRVPCS